MEAFTVLEGLVAPMDRANVDTDLIIPKQFLKSIKRSGFGPNLFDELRYLDHGDWTKIGITGAVCRAIPAGEAIVPATLYVFGWFLMLLAMMLPTTLPLLEIYRRLIRRHNDRHVLMGLVLLGYFTAWGGFGLAAHVLDLGLFK